MFPFERFDDVLGIGASDSIIVQGSHKQNKKQVAIKVYQKKHLSNNQIEEIRGVISIYQSAQHFYVLRLEDYFENREHFYLCFELSSAVTLERYIKSQKEKIAEFRVQQIALQLIEALEYLHDHGIILRNL